MKEMAREKKKAIRQKLGFQDFGISKIQRYLFYLGRCGHKEG
jgi:hypothetical protein